MKRMKATKPSRRGVRLSELSTPTEEVVEEPVVEEPVVEVPKPKPKAKKPKAKKTSKAKKSEENGGTKETI